MATPMKPFDQIGACPRRAIALAFAKKFMRILIVITLIVGALVSLVFLLDASYDKRPIATEARISSAVVEQGARITVTVEAKNRNFRKDLVIPAYHTVPGKYTSMNGVGFFYLPSGSEYHSNINHIGLFLEPRWDKLAARDSRRYEFYWNPGDTAAGEGTLFLTLPDEFEPVEPFKIRIIKEANKAEMATPKKPSD